VDTSFSQVRAAVEKYARQSRASEVGSGKKPAPLDVQQLAKDRGLEAGQIALSDPIQVQQHELGKTFEFDFSTGRFERIPFHLMAYRDAVPLHKPEQIRGENFEVHFLYWKTSQQEPFVPELKDIREEVVDAWKLHAALALAEAEGKAMAEKAKQSGKTLKELFADNKDLTVTDTNEFTWMTTGFVPAGMGMPALSSVDGVQHAGPDFMRSVFSLAVGQAGVAVNQPRSIVYVVRISSESPSDETLREMFLQIGASMELQHVAAMDRQGIRRDWFDAIQREMDLKWIRPPQS
jgi:hypothetical protein